VLWACALVCQTVVCLGCVCRKLSWGPKGACEVGRLCSWCRLLWPRDMMFGATPGTAVPQRCVRGCVCLFCCKTATRNATNYLHEFNEAT
jgi:hypothetical protein